MIISNKLQRKALSNYLKILKTKFKRYINDVILFGSAARGENKSDSDIDVLIITKGGGRKLKENIGMAGSGVVLETAVIISPLVMDFKTYSWHKKYHDPLYNAIERDGANLWTKKLKF